MSGVNVDVAVCTSLELRGGVEREGGCVIVGLDEWMERGDACGMFCRGTCVYIDSRGGFVGVWRWMHCSLASHCAQLSGGQGCVFLPCFVSVRVCILLVLVIPLCVRR